MQIIILLERHEDGTSSLLMDFELDDYDSSDIYTTELLQCENFNIWNNSID